MPTNESLSELKKVRHISVITMYLIFGLFIGAFGLLQNECPLVVHAQIQSTSHPPLTPPVDNQPTTSSLPPLPSSSKTTTTRSSPSTTPVPLITSNFTGSAIITVKQVVVGTDNLIPHSKFRITPNPFTLKGSLVINDNNNSLDSDPTDGVTVLKNVKFSPYLINETESSGFGPVLLKTRITVHRTNPHPVVTIENRQLDLPFKGIAVVTAPFLNDSSFRTYVANGAKLGNIPITRADELPSGFLISSEKELANISPIKTMTFRTGIPVTASALQIYDSFKIPVYPAPVKDIASHVIYVSPAMVVKQQDSGYNNNFIMTPIIAKVFPGMSLLLNHSSSVASGLAKVENVKMKFGEDVNNIGFIFGISNNIPSVFGLPKVPFDKLALFMNIIYIGGEGGKVVNFSNPKSFASSPEIKILVSKAFNITKLADGCPDIRLISINESVATVAHEASWKTSIKPIRDKGTDSENACGYTLKTGHFSKFAVGGSISPPLQESQ